ncbi:hypothetical protein AS149_37110 [Burkholderia cenocepacia]|nr:hypothetical protein AS149_37110 [Burkholderia cenocepacia]
MYVSRSAAVYQEGNPDTIIISIHSSFGEPASLREGWRDKLVLAFDNVETLSHRLTRFGRNDAEAVIAYLRRHENEAKHVLVHCDEGTSRSPAIAKFVAEVYELPFKAVEKYNHWVYDALKYVYERQQSA